MRYFIELVDYSDCEDFVSNSAILNRMSQLRRVLIKNGVYLWPESSKQKLYIAKKVAKGAVPSFVLIAQLQHKYDKLRGELNYLSSQDNIKFIKQCLEDEKDEDTKKELELMLSNKERGREKYNFGDFQNSFKYNKTDLTFFTNYYSLGFILGDTEESYNLFQSIKNKSFEKDPSSSIPGDMGFLLEDKE